MNKKLITGTITLAALLGIGASANIGVNAAIYHGNNDVRFTKGENGLYGPESNSSHHIALDTNGSTGYTKSQVEQMQGNNGYLPQNNENSYQNNNTNSNNSNNQSTQYANSNTLPQTSESKNAKDVALAGLSALAASVALIGADPAKEAMKNKIVDRRLKYGI